MWWRGMSLCERMSKAKTQIGLLCGMAAERESMTDMLVKCFNLPEA